MYAMHKPVRGDSLTFFTVKNKLMSVFHGSVLLLAMNFIITLSKQYM